MFFRNDTKVIVTRLDLSIPGMLGSMTPANSYLVSTLADFSASSDAQAIIYGDSYLSIGESVNRGVHSSPGSVSGYTLSLATHICTASGITNNEVLWDLFLTGETSMEHAVQPTAISNRSNHSALREFSILVLNGSYCKAYTGCIITGLNINMQMSSILVGSWDIVCNNCINVSTSDISYLFTGSDITGVGIDSDVEYILDKLTLVTLNGVNVPVLQSELAFNHNVSVVPDTTINSVGSITGYQLGSFTIDGALRLYTRIGDTSALVDSITEAYKTNSDGLNMPLSILFKGPSADLRLTIGNVFAVIPQDNADPVLTTTIVFSANNHVDNGLMLEKV